MLFFWLLQRQPVTEHWHAPKKHHHWLNSDGEQKKLWNSTLFLHNNTSTQYLVTSDLHSQMLLACSAFTLTLYQQIHIFLYVARTRPLNTPNYHWSWLYMSENSVASHQGWPLSGCVAEWGKKWLQTWSRRWCLNIFPLLDTIKGKVSDFWMTSSLLKFETKHQQNMESLLCLNSSSNTLQENPLWTYTYKHINMNPPPVSDRLEQCLLWSVVLFFLSCFFPAYRARLCMYEDVFNFFLLV